MVGLQDLQKHLPDSTLPPSLGGSLLPSRAVTATAGAQALESPVRSSNKKLPMAPPRQRPVPERRQSFPDMATLETNRQTAQPPAGAVNRMKDLFEQKKDQKKDEHTVVSPQRRPHNGVSRSNPPPPNKPIKMLPVPPQRTSAAATNIVRTDHKGDKGRINAGKVALTVLNIGSNSKSSGDKTSSKSDIKPGTSSKPVNDRPPLPPSNGGGNKKKQVYSEYETVEITPMPSSPTKPRSSKPRSIPPAPPASNKPREPSTAVPAASSKPPPVRPVEPPAASSKPPPVRPVEPPAASSKPPPVRPVEPPAASSKPPPKSQYENIQIKRTGHDDSELLIVTLLSHDATIYSD